MSGIAMLEQTLFAEQVLVHERPSREVALHNSGCEPFDFCWDAAAPPLAAAAGLGHRGARRVPEVPDRVLPGQRGRAGRPSADVPRAARPHLHHQPHRHAPHLSLQPIMQDTLAWGQRLTCRVLHGRTYIISLTGAPRILALHSVMQYTLYGGNGKLVLPSALLLC